MTELLNFVSSVCNDPFNVMTVSSACVFFQQPDEEVDKCWAALMSLNNNVTEVPADRQLLLQVRVGIASQTTLFLTTCLSGPQMLGYIL